MFRLLLSLLLVSLVLAIDQSTDGRVNRRKIMKPDSPITYNFLQRRKQQQPHVEITEENAGRYFRRRPQTSTVSSIFSMKVESESQHVYPNMNPSENLNVTPKPEEINLTDISIPKQQQNFTLPTNWNNPRSNNAHRRVTNTRRRRPSIIRTPAPSIQQAEEITEKVITTTSAPIVVDSTVNEQQKIVLPTSDSNVLNEESSSENRHPTISQIPEAFIQRVEEIPEQVVIPTSKSPVVVSTTEKESEKLEFTPSVPYVSNRMSFVKRRRPSFGRKTASPAIHQEETASEQVIDSTTTAPIAISIAAKHQEKTVLSPASYVSDLISIVRPKSRRTFNRGSHKYNSNDIKKDQTNVQVGDLDSNLSQVTSTTSNTPPPVPTLSPWYDGFGK